MSRDHDPSFLDLRRRRLLQGAAALPLAGLGGYAGAQATAAVNTTKLAITDTEVVVGQLHSATGTMAISETGSIQNWKSRFTPLRLSEITVFKREMSNAYGIFTSPAGTATPT